jgi:asparagine synthase (glutamine-hydrolysing)
MTPEMAGDPGIHLVEAMMADQAHRGPDCTHVRSHGLHTVLGHNRLAITDPRSTAAEQPMVACEERVSIVFNGEVFNHRELRTELEGRGHVFNTRCDTEVLLHMYLEYGERMLERLDGQFAFVVSDNRTGTLLAARDRLGIKPLFYAKHRGQVLFSSSFKSLLRRTNASLDPDALGEYLFLRFVLPPRTLARGILQVQPGCLLRINPRGEITPFRYWDFKPGATPRSLAEAADGVREAVRSSVVSQSDSDVPVGVLLSGGLDSAIVAAIASGPREGMPMYSIGFGRHGTDELAHANLMAKACRAEHHVLNVDEAAAGDDLRDCIARMDHPSGARDAIGVFLLSRLVHEQTPHVKVILCGTGADEIFNGYANAYFAPGDGKMRRDALVPVATRFLSRYCFTNDATWQAVGSLRRFRPSFERVATRIGRRLGTYADAWGVPDEANAVNLMYQTTHLAGWELPIADDMAMQFAIETRVPFVDHKLVELALGIPGGMKYQDGIEKVVLRKAFENALPPSIANRQKEPFSRQIMAGLLERTLLEEGSQVRRMAVELGLVEFTDLDLAAHGDLAWRIHVLRTWIDVNNPSWRFWHA